MIQELLEPLWLVDEASGRTCVDVALRAVTEARHPAPAAIARADVGPQYASTSGLRLVRGPHTVTAGAGAAAGVSGQVQLGALVVVPVFGLVQQHRGLLTQWGFATSTDAVLRAVRAAVADPQVSGVLLHFHSPGGSVYGVKVLADYLLSARKIKPIWGQADSMATSAAYWLLACCGRAVATPMADVGSVGCLIVHTSVREADEKLGIKRTVIRAGKYKASESEFMDLDAEAAERVQARVDAAYVSLVSGVARGRGVTPAMVRQGFGEGAVVPAGAAAAQGMLDDVAPLQDTLGALARQVRGGRGVGARSSGRISLGALARQVRGGRGVGARSSGRISLGGTHGRKDLERIRLEAELGILGASGARGAS